MCHTPFVSSLFNNPRLTRLRRPIMAACGEAHSFERFKMKENQHVKPVVDVEKGIITFKVKGLADLVFDTNKCSAVVMKRAAMVGMAQVRIMDMAAIPMQDKDGNIIPEARRITMKRERMAEGIAHYESGTEEWSRVSEGGFGKSITLEGIAELKGVTYEEAEAFVEAQWNAAKDAEGRGFRDAKAFMAYLRTGPKLAEKIEEIRKRRMPAPKVDADAALEALKAA